MSEKEEKWSDEHYHYRMISPPQIIKASRGPLNLDDRFPADSRSPLDRRIANQRILEAYLTEQGLKGWELVTQLLYEGLPYGGGLIFKKKIKIAEKDTEVSEEEVDFEKNTEANLYAIYEDQTSKNAVWRGKETKAFQEWKKNYESEKR